MTERKHIGLLNAGRMHPVLRTIVFSQGNPVDYIDHGALDIEIAEYISDYPESDARLAVRAAAVYCHVPTDNSLFAELSDTSELVMTTTNCIELSKAAVKDLKKYGAQLTAVVRCPDGVVFFGRCDK